jgi:hypothetical protein
MGSLIIEPLLKRVGFLPHADYNHFIAACKKDPKIDILSESNNMYRTLCSLLILLVLLWGYALLEAKYPMLKRLDGPALVVILLGVFLMSYRKQTAYINKRVKANKESQ